MSDREDKLTRSIISGDIARDSVGAKLTPEAHERAVDFAMKQTGKGLNFGQLKNIGISHVTSEVFKDK